MRVGVFSDIAYHRSPEGVVSTNQAFVGFVANLAPRIDELVVFGRLDPTPSQGAYELTEPGLRFVPLPHYHRVTDVWGQVRAAWGTVRVFDRELANLDAVWIFGPHPLGVVLALWAKRRRKPLVLGVRQDYPRYIAGRLPSRAWRWAVGAAWALDRTFRVLARRASTVAVGDDLAAKYARGGPVLSTGFSLVTRSQIATPEAPRTWGDPIRILSVGRLDPEKNPLLLVEVIRRLSERDRRWRLTIAGSGSLEPQLRQAVAAAQLEDVVEFAGYVRQGSELDELYRRHDVFLHVSWTEGLPQVLFEAQAAALPVVATAVGGVAAAVGATDSAILIPPGDAAAATAALELLADDPVRRAGLVERGTESVLDQTMEAQLDRIAQFIAQATRA